MSARRLQDSNGDIVRFEGSNGMSNRQNRWPILTTTQNPNSRLTVAEEKARRSQVFRRSRNFISASSS